MGLNWLITGGCGFIGVNLVRLLQKEEGHQIRLFDNLTVGSREDLARVSTFEEGETDWSDQVSLRVGDILDSEAIEKAMEGADVVVHLAANTGVGPSVEDPKKDALMNVTGIVNVLEAARENGVKKFVFASSGAPVGECEPPIHEEKVPHPVSPYGASKLAGEGYCSAYYQTFGIDTVALRFGNVYGPYSGNKASVVAKFIRQAIDGETLEVYGSGKQTRDFIYVDDLVGAILKAAVKEQIGGEIFQIATNKESTLLELLDVLMPLLREHVGHSTLIHGEERLGDVMRNFSDTSKAARMLDWRAETQLEEGLRETLKWFLKQK